LTIASLPGESSHDERWMLPKMESHEAGIYPEDTAEWLAKYRLQLDLETKDLDLLCTYRSETGYPIYLFANKDPLESIEILFTEERTRGYYQSMTFHRAGLPKSGLNYLHRQILSEGANLINCSGSSLNKPELRIVRSRDDLQTKTKGSSAKSP